MRLIAAVALLLTFVALGTPADGGPVYVTLWFDTEDYILPASDDAAMRLAETLSGLGIRATFKVVGEKARMLERRGRRDVIAALRRHEIGYHTDCYGQPGASWAPPEDYLATVGAVLEQLILSGTKPARIELRKGNFTASRFVAADSVGLWGWIIFPEGFRAPRLMDLAALQS